MRKIFIILFLMLSIFTVINAHPFKTEKELKNFFSKMDQLIKEELKTWNLETKEIKQVYKLASRFVVE